MAEAARLGDQVSHTYAVVGEIGGAIAGAFLGGLVAGAVVAATAATGGLALLIFVGVGAAVGGAVHSGANTAAQSATAPTGVLVSSPNVFINGRNAVRAVEDFSMCVGLPANLPPHPTALVAEGSGTVYINGRPAARIGSALICSARISQGSSNVNIGGPTEQLLEVNPEVSFWVKAVGFVAAIPFGNAGARVGGAASKSISSRFSSTAGSGVGTAAVGKAPVKEILVSRSKYPESAKHIEDAQAAGHPDVVTINRPGAVANRSESLKDVPTRKGLDRDEYPPAVFKEGGQGASVRHIPPSDNRGAGASMGGQIRGLPDGTKVRIKVVD